MGKPSVVVVRHTELFVVPLKIKFEVTLPMQP